MKDHTLKLKYQNSIHRPRVYSQTRRNINICSEILRQYFEIGEADTIYLKLSAKPSKDSYKVFNLPHSVGIEIVDSKGEQVWILMYTETKKALKALVGKAKYFYVSVEYS